MKRIKKIFLWVHVALWFVFSLLVGQQLGHEGNPDWLVLSAGFVSADLYVFYGHLFLLARLQGRNKKGEYLLGVVTIALTAPLFFLLSHYLKASARPDFVDYYAMALVTIVPIFLILSWLARVTENLVLNTFRKEELEKIAVETELNYLKSQINPHFLFNTLHNIHTLVYKKAATAPEAVLRLASLMRYMIYESNALLVPLSREIEYLEDYIALQQLRYRESPIVDLTITGVEGVYRVAPLLFIHLIENAYKHSPARMQPGAIKVCLEITGDTLTFEIQNPIVASTGKELAMPGGLGLANVHKRLALLYPGKHELKTTTLEGVFTVRLKIAGLRIQVHE